MSRSYTSRPAVARQGRGATQNRTNPQVGMGRGQTNMNQQTSERDQPQPQEPTPTQEKIQRRDAYTMIAPDEKKRQTIAQKAKAEEDAYTRHKQQRQLGHVSYVGTVGGGEVTEGAARQQSQRETRQAATRAKVGVTPHKQYKQSVKEKDQKEADKKKAVQRRKAEQNKLQDRQRQTTIQEDHRQKNASFLDRIEQENRQKKGEKILSSSAATTASVSGAPAGAASGATSGAASGSSLQPVAPPSGQHGNNNDDASLDLLQSWFPDYERLELATILEQVNGDVDMARNLLLM